MADKNVDVTINPLIDPPHPTGWSWTVEDPIDMGTGPKALKFKRSPASAPWTFQGVAIWKEGDVNANKSMDSVVEPFHLGDNAVKDNQITIDDNDTGPPGVETKFEYKLWAKVGDVTITHDPQIINRGA